MRKEFVSIASKVATQVKKPLLWLTLAALLMLSATSYYLSLTEMKKNAYSRVNSVERSTASAIYNFDFEQLSAITATFDNDHLFLHFSIWSEGEMLAQTRELGVPTKELIWNEWEHKFPLSYVNTYGEEMSVGHIEAYVNPEYLLNFFALSISIFLASLLLISLLILIIVRRSFHKTVAYRLKHLSSQFNLQREQNEYEHLTKIEDYPQKERDEISDLVDAYNLSSLHAARYIEAINKNNELLTTLAQKDPLTGNLNRQAFLENMNKTLEKLGTYGTLVRINILNFSSINLKYGQQHGDDILKRTSLALTQHSPANASVCRLGGDDFFLFLPACELSDSKSIFSNIQDSLTPLDVNINIGISRHPEDASEAELLIHCAEIALLEATELKLDYCEYHEEFESALKHTIYIDSFIEELIATQKFHMHYQPQMHLTTFDIFGAESLLRLEENDRSSPWEVITRAEKTGTMHALTLAIIEKVFKDWQQSIHTCPNSFTLSINISPLSLSKAHFSQKLLSLASRYNFPLNKLVLELTELAKVQQQKEVNDNLQHLRASGVRFSLDDFGTGFSSLEYLLSYGFDEIKIDRKFVMDLDKREESIQIIKVINFLCQTLGMQAIAEGIETEEEERTLQRLGVTIGQGFRYSRALPISQLMDYVSQRKNMELKRSLN
ncbi:bifunctional diguanylate cyclase/phosphodiesterase [Vibrio penaeicida]|uniref:bifunctional diguanylate cyclase/phosphodiesterase n=1 Tax=Vibrio penaeicida TaxID=104609 RepID=UPI0027326500|nr:bifunctional diguanylate cyclase/phosphodiesterase [Vibrio penaeicida]MDP2571242.1 bifunctional diguanylate cyclase/phosphodiesterase [Vibrio penaeicida]